MFFFNLLLPIKINFPVVVRQNILLLIFFGSSSSMLAQVSDTLIVNSESDSLHISKNSDSLLERKTVQRRIRVATAVQAGVYGAAMAGLYSTWYKDYPQSGFHFYNDSKEWKGMDKIGHAYSAYALSKASMEMWRWTGIQQKKAIWLGGLSGAVFQTVIETLDGFSTNWGWSWADFAANTMGSGILISQELLWGSQRIQLKTSFHQKTYAQQSLNQRSDQLFGPSLPERFLKDYNGQTYWLSANLRQFFPSSSMPKWLQISVGTGAEGMFGGYENIALDENNQVVFDRRDIPRRRQWYLAPDIDLTQIDTNKRGIKILLYVLNMFKFPSPALELTGGKLQVNWMAF